MMQRYLGFLLALTMIVLSVLLLVQKEEAFHILYKPKSYSYYAQTTKEEFDISFLASSNDSFYLDASSLSRATIVNQQTNEEVGLLINDIDVNEEIIVGGQTYYYASFKCELSVETTNLEVTYDDASLHLVYQNQDTLQIPLGEFYYAYQSTDHYLRVQELVATHDMYYDLTVSGIYVSLSHTLQSTVQIVDVTIGSGVAKVNYPYVTEVDKPIQYTDKVIDVLGVMSYQEVGQVNGALSFYLRPKQSLNIYLPLLYQYETLAIHRCYIKIAYYVDGEYQEEIIDDFPYIKQNIIEIKEEEYHVYVPDTQDN